MKNQKLYDTFCNRFIVPETKKYQNIDKNKLEILLDRINNKYEDMLVKAIEHNNCYFTIAPQKTPHYKKCYCSNNADETHCLISLNGYNDASLYHELGHLFDYVFDNDSHKYVQLSFDARNNEGKSLYDKLTEEIQSKKQILFDQIIKEYYSLLEKEVGIDAVKYMVDDYNDYVELKSLERKCGGYLGTMINSKKNIKEENVKKYKEKFQDNIKRNFVSRYNLVDFSNSLISIHKKYSIILDALDHYYDLKPYHLNIHGQKYYQHDFLYSTEFMANLFSILLIDDNESLNILKSLLPISTTEFMWVIKLASLRYYSVDSNLNIK